MRPFRRCFLTLATIAAPALLLAGCGGSQLASFDLAAAPMGKMRAGAIRGVLAVAEPVADGPLDSERIVIRTGPDQLAYLSGAKWAGNLPSLLQSKIIASFENAHLVKSVVRPGGVSDYSLHVDIRRFEVDVVDRAHRTVRPHRLRWRRQAGGRQDILRDDAGRPNGRRQGGASARRDAGECAAPDGDLDGASDLTAGCRA
ncbi:MAG: membrane integrity-associated transporter subunit PqiC [Hyphomicrobiales bacterium]|nr:membrane integrity-associated transporter subunit PqiC [Hyphomicrobiales bacterium]